MRTTITLDEDVGKRLQQMARRTNRTFKALVNETLRRGLAAGVRPPSPSKRFVVRPKACGFRAGIDLLRLNQLSDELETDTFVKSDHDRPKAP
jgi:hypothetical protein